MSSRVGKDTGMDVVDLQMEPYLTIDCVCMLAAPLWCLTACQWDAPTD